MKLLLTNSTDDNKARAGECGAIGMIVSAIKVHTNNLNVCEYGCKTLCNITLNNGKTSYTKQKRTLAKSIPYYYYRCQQR